MSARVGLALSLALGFFLLASSLAAQPPAKAVRVGVLRPAPDDAIFRRNVEPFRQTLRENGFVEGTNLTIEYRVRPGSAEDIAGLADELVRLRVDAILAISPAGVRAAARATTTIPIVAVDLESDPVQAGFATSLARPGGNVTGLFLDFPELSGKWVQLLKEAIPGLTRVGVLWDPATGPSFLRAAQVAVPAMRVQLLPLEAKGPEDLAGALRSAVDGRVGALLVLSSPVFNSARREIAELAAKHRLPALMPFPGFAEDGGLMAYGPHVGNMFQQAAAVMVKILRGTRPGDLSIERPARFELVINLKTAKALGLTLPQSLLRRADQVVQ